MPQPTFAAEIAQPPAMLAVALPAAQALTDNQRIEGAFELLLTYGLLFMIGWMVCWRKVSDAISPLADTLVMSCAAVARRSVGVAASRRRALGQSTQT